MKIANWGNYPKIDAELRSFDTERALRRHISGFNEFIPRGMGRCYGDSALSSNILSTLKFNCMLSFNDGSGELVCESGVTLEDILNTFIPRGWFLPVTPGTKFVTVGGCIASDVHGKNHHISGSFSSRLRWMDVMLSTGEVTRCSKEDNPELFWATCGGMGLTGIIIRACFCLIPIQTSFIRQETMKASNLEEIMDMFSEFGKKTYSVAWIDCLSRGKGQGRSVLMLGEHAKPEELYDKKGKGSPLKLSDKKTMNVPFYFPNFALNTLSSKLFNAVYYAKAKKNITSIVDYENFFYPLDAVQNWNRIYGKRGFTQYQFVLPAESSREGLRVILDRIVKSGSGSFLAVLKLLGEQQGLISFPKAGYTLALDFPISRKIFALLDELDSMVLDFGGRLYLTKDVRMGRKMFDRGYEASDEFRKLKKRFDAEGKLASLQSKRIEV